MKLVFEKWQPGKVVVIQSNSHGQRHLRLMAACNQIDYFIIKLIRLHRCK